jgi:hypothetical protein
MVKDEVLRRTVAHEATRARRPNRKTGRSKTAGLHAENGGSKGAEHPGLLDFVEQRHSRLSHIICAPIPDSATSGGTIDKQGVWLTRTKE